MKQFLLILIVAIIIVMSGALIKLLNFSQIGNLVLAAGMIAELVIVILIVRNIMLKSKSNC